MSRYVSKSKLYLVPPIDMVLQTTTFEAERQSYFDNEQHLKSRIQSLTQARKNSDAQKREEFVETRSISISISDVHEEEANAGDDSRTPIATNPANDFLRDDDDEPAEMTALRLELSTLSTSYASLQNTVQHLSSQLLDLRRVNKSVQEENESYKILLFEKTLSGQFDISRTGVTSKDSDEGSDSGTEDMADEDLFDTNDRNSVLSGDRATLDPVDEVPEDTDMDTELDMEAELSQPKDDAADSSSVSSRGDRSSRRQGRGGRRVPKTSRSPASNKGESLANLPISGPGLDLAAELGRAENMAILGGTTDKIDSKDRSVANGITKTKRSRRATTAAATGQDAGKEDGAQPAGEVNALRNEVKSLKDANKALSLYASKIIDRIVATGGFEHVLAADYDNLKSTPSSPTKPKTLPPKKVIPENPSPQKKARPQSSIFSRGYAAEPDAIEKPLPSPALPSTSTSPPQQSADQRSKEKRRSMSFDWRSLTMFGTAEKKPEMNPNLRPLTLRPGTSIVGVRKLDTHEDEEDKKERERMLATLKLMGIEKPSTPTTPSDIIKSPPSDTGTGQSSEVSSPKPQASRFSFFRSRSAASDDASIHSGNSANTTPNLTQEALEHAEAQTTIAALDEREKVLSAEIAKGSNGGFTEVPRRQRGEEWKSRRSKRSGESGSASTVWSAGMSNASKDGQ